MHLSRTVQNSVKNSLYQPTSTNIPVEPLKASSNINQETVENSPTDTIRKTNHPSYPERTGLAMVSSSLFCCLRARGSMRARAMSKTDLSNCGWIFPKRKYYGNIWKHPHWKRGNIWFHHWTLFWYFLVTPKGVSVKR